MAESDSEIEWDVLLVYSGDDLNKAIVLRDYLESRNITVCFYDRDLVDGSSSDRWDWMNKAIYKSQYIALYLTDNFAADDEADAIKKECLVKTVIDKKKKNSLIPIWEYDRRKQSRRDFGIQRLIGVELYRTANWYDNVETLQGKKNLDNRFCRLINQVITGRKNIIKKVTSPNNQSNGVPGIENVQNQRHAPQVANAGPSQQDPEISPETLLQKLDGGFWEILSRLNEIQTEAKDWRHFISKLFGYSIRQIEKMRSDFEPMRKITSLLKDNNVRLYQAVKILGLLERNDIIRDLKEKYGGDLIKKCKEKGYDKQNVDLTAYSEVGDIGFELWDILLTLNLKQDINGDWRNFISEFGFSNEDIDRINGVEHLMRMEQVIRKLLINKPDCSLLEIVQVLVKLDRNDVIYMLEREYGAFIINRCKILDLDRDELITVKITNRDEYVQRVTYLTENLIGSGSFGLVRKCMFDQKPAAEKHMDLIGNVENNDKNTYEAVNKIIPLWTDIKCQNIVKLYAFYVNRDEFCANFVMEYVKHGNLAQFIREKNETGFTEKTLINLMLDVATAFDYMHSKKPPIVHRDIKADNILIHDRDTEENGCRYVAKLTDFDFLREYHTDSNSVSSGGNAAFTAPELVQSMAKRKDIEDKTKCDIYSISFVYWEMCDCSNLVNDSMEQLMFMADCVRKQYRPSKPKFLSDYISDQAIWDIIKTCWDHEPNNRPSAKNIICNLGTLTL